VHTGASAADFKLSALEERGALVSVRRYGYSML
jgi:hypothetical protein